MDGFASGVLLSSDAHLSLEVFFSACFSTWRQLEICKSSALCLRVVKTQKPPFKIKTNALSHVMFAILIVNPSKLANKYIMLLHFLVTFDRFDPTHNNRQHIKVDINTKLYTLLNEYTCVYTLSRRKTKFITLIHSNYRAI